MKPELIIMRGLPASGKTTLAKQWVAGNPCGRLRVNRDDLRSMLHDGEYVKPVGKYATKKEAAKYGTEQTVIKMRDKLIDEALCSGISVVNDDCNLSSYNVKELMKIAKRCGAEFSITDLTDVPLETCLLRDYQRDRSVGERVIGDMHKRYLKGKQLPLEVPVLKVAEANAERVRYETPSPIRSDLKACVIFDIDGTLARMDGRSPYDYSLIHTDKPDHHVVNSYWLYRNAGYHIIFLSGRPDSCRQETEAWLKEHVTEGDPVALLMRAREDRRDDSQVKYELFDTYVRNQYAVHCVFDDRNRVVEMWRSIGLKCYQVEPGDF